jgi:hypothetical protein
MIERLLGATEDEVLSELKGNTRILRTDARLITKSVDPFRFAAWTLPALYELLEDYLFNERPNRPHPALGVSPNEYEARRLRETGHREFKGVIFDENIMLLTCPHAARPYHKVDPQRGVWVDGLWYQHPALRTLKKGAKVEVRVEPWNARVVYVQVPAGWVAAIGSDSRWLYRSTRREMELALRAERRKANRDAARATVNPSMRKHRQIAWSPENFDSRLAVQQEEMRYLYDKKGMTLALPKQVPQDLEAVNPSLDTPIPQTTPTTVAHLPDGLVLEAKFPVTIAQVVTEHPLNDTPPHSAGEAVMATVDVYEVVDDPKLPGGKAGTSALLKRIGRFR